MFAVDQNRGLRNITLYDACSDPMVFPVLFPSGELGWEMRMPHQNGGNRQGGNNYSVIHGSGKLSEQYIITVYVRIKANNIECILKNQDKLWSEEYVGLTDYLHNQAEDDDVAVW